MGERVVLPTPFPVGPVNVWVLQGDPLTLVDAGPRTRDALTALEAGVASLGLRLEDVQLLVLTHQHHLSLVRIELALRYLRQRREIGRKRGADRAPDETVMWTKPPRSQSSRYE